MRLLFDVKDQATTHVDVFVNESLSRRLELKTCVGLWAGSAQPRVPNDVSCLN